MTYTYDYETGKWVVKDEADNIIASFDTEAEARNYPGLAEPTGTSTTDEVATGASAGNTRWVERTKTKPGHWEIQETAMGQTRWRDMTFDEFQAAEWEAEPGPLSPEFLRARFEQGPFAEVGPSVAVAGGGAGGAGGATLEMAPVTAEEVRQQDFLELNAALEAKGITGDEFQFALAYGLSLSDLRQMQTLGITQEEAAPGLVRGISINEMGTAKLLDVPVPDYIWARSQGLTDADIRNATLAGQSLPEKVGEVKTSAAATQAEAEFEDVWGQRTTNLRPTLLSQPGVAAALEEERQKEREAYIKRRTQELATAALEQPTPEAAQPGVLELQRAAYQGIPPREYQPPGPVTVPGPGRETITYTPGAGEFKAKMPEPLPGERLPTADELITRVARRGDIPTVLSEAEQAARWPRPKGGYPVQVGVGGGGLQAPGLGALGGVGMMRGMPGGMPLTPLGEEFFRIQYGAGLEQQAQEKQAKAELGQQYAQAYIGTLGALAPKTEPLPEEKKPKKEKSPYEALG
jgi:hypothetical protein